MIFGLGVDLVDHARIEKIIQTRELKFINKVLSKNEKKRYSSVRIKAQYLASRFAAKEALGKALKTGITNPLLFTNIGIVSIASSPPHFEFSRRLQDYLKYLTIKNIHLSISHEKRFSVAMVTVEK